MARKKKVDLLTNDDVCAGCGQPMGGMIFGEDAMLLASGMYVHYRDLSCFHRAVAKVQRAQDLAAPAPVEKEEAVTPPPNPNQAWLDMF